MTYPAIGFHRMPYDLDGTEVGKGYVSTGVQSWLTSSDKIKINNESSDYIDAAEANNGCIWFFFPELREIEAIYWWMTGYHVDQMSLLEGSDDSTNGMDGTWETATLPSGYPSPVDDFSWRSGIKPVSFSGPKKIIRGRWGQNIYGSQCLVIHVFGRKYAGEQPHDLIFCDSSGDPFTALIDWGDQPEGTTEIGTFKVKNDSASKIANNINLQLNHADFSLSWASDGPWVTVLDIATLGVGALSNPVYVKNELGPPLLILGPKAARVIATVGSWT